MENGELQPREGIAGTEQRVTAAIGRAARYGLLLLAVAAAVKWMPSPWNAIAGAVLLSGAAVTRSYQRRLARRVRAIPRVRAAVAWLIVPPPDD